MGWATTYIEKLKAGETISFRPKGGSMTGKIESGDLCVVSPLSGKELKVGDIVLCKVGNSEYLHLIHDINRLRYLFQIGNNKGHINGWISYDKIFGKCIQVENKELI